MDNELSPQDVHMFYMLLFNLILRHDDRLRLDVAEAIRRILQNPISEALTVAARRAACSITAKNC